MDKQLTVRSENTSDVTNAIATQHKNAYQFLFYSFEKSFHPDSTASKKCQISLLLPKNSTAKKIRIYQIGRIENNIVAAWKKMNKPTYLSKSKLMDLQKLNTLILTKQQWTIRKAKEGQFLEMNVDLPGVTFIEILK